MLIAFSIWLNTSFLSSNNSCNSLFCRTIKFSKSWSFLFPSAILLNSNSSKVFWYSSSILCRRFTMYSLSLLLLSIKLETKRWLSSCFSVIKCSNLLLNFSDKLFNSSCLLVSYQSTLLSIFSPINPSLSLKFSIISDISFFEDSFKFFAIFCNDSSFFSFRLSSKIFSSSIFLFNNSPWDEDSPKEFILLIISVKFSLKLFFTDS